MKTVLIIILTLALLAAAAVTRPDRREFMLHLLDQQSNQLLSNGDLDKVEQIARSVNFHNRILWTDVEKDGKVIYTGAFAHFVARGEAAGSQTVVSTEMLAKVMGR